MGISSLMDIASSALNAQQAALAVTGENIANVNTPGYSRQQVVMVNGPVVNSNGLSLGTGVEVQTVQRSSDAMLQQQIVSGNSTYQQSLAKQSALEQIQPAFNEVVTDGLGAAVDNFFGAWQELSANPQGTAERQSLLSASQTLTDTFHQMSTNLTGIATSEDNNLTGITADVTSNAKSLAQVNTQILTTQAVGGNTNELLDQRDLLLQHISQEVGITSTLQSDGTATVTLAGGNQLVSGAKYATLYTSPNAATPPTNDILLSGLGNPPPVGAPASDTNVTATIGGNGGTGNNFGEIGGTLQVRDTIVPGYLGKLNEMASNLVSSVNAQQSVGYGMDGPPPTTGNNFFDPAGLTSATIALDPSLTASKIAAGYPTAADPIPTSAGNNTNALKIAAIQQQSNAFSTGGDTFDGFYSSLVSAVGTDTQDAQHAVTQGSASLQQLQALRDSNSAVSLNDELTNLTKYQQAFEGASKVINAATSMLDTVLAMVGAPT
jgi:flagellar hook-associated protein 1 FlgK